MDPNPHAIGTRRLLFLSQFEKRAQGQTRLPKGKANQPPPPYVK